MKDYHNKIGRQVISYGKAGAKFSFSQFRQVDGTTKHHVLGNSINELVKEISEEGIKIPLGEALPEGGELDNSELNAFYARAGKLGILE